MTSRDIIKRENVNESVLGRVYLMTPLPNGSLYSGRNQNIILPAYVAEVGAIQSDFKLLNCTLTLCFDNSIAALFGNLINTVTGVFGCRIVTHLEFVWYTVRIEKQFRVVLQDLRFRSRKRRR